MVLRLIFALAVILVFLFLMQPIYGPSFHPRGIIEARLQLKHMHELQHVHHKMNAVYAKDFETIGFEAPETMFEGGEARYTYEIVDASENHFLARAKAIEDFDGDGQINLWEITEKGELKEVIPD